ncbi:MAG: TrkA family potassium uptake protein [Endomicrobia bacterium]|nr:TrkA family potassium uptake protein [Endomicrobiia bacterium]MCL2506655.1 TrkA family potassium uptake protein [Endomicrobiia bacterium]
MAKKQFGIIGLGTFGFNLALELTKKGAEVLVIDNNADIINKISADIAQALVVDAADNQALKRAGIADCDTVIISIGESIEASILITLIVKSLGVKNIVVKCVNDWHQRIASEIGITQIVYPEFEMAKKLAGTLMSPNVLDELKLSKNCDIVEFAAPKKFFNKTIGELDVRRNFRVTIIALRRSIQAISGDDQENIEKDITISPSPDTEILEDDSLVVIGSSDDIDRIKKI